MVERRLPNYQSSPRKGKRSQLSEDAASYVRELIMSGGVRPGDFLRMDRIAAAIGVSNTPVREGLLAIQAEGFVRLVPRRGFVVAPFTRQDVHDLFWAQSLIAGELAARAASKITPEQLSRLEANLEDYDEALATGEKDRSAEIGHLFHREINLASESVRLALLLGSVVRHLPNRFYATIEGRLERTTIDHPRLVDALREGDQRTTREIMEQHILSGAETLIATLESQGFWEPEEADSSVLSSNLNGHDPT